MTEKTKVLPTPVIKMSFFRSLLSHLPGFCKYCGHYYVSCHTDYINLWMPINGNGRCCPNGHEGWIEEFYGWGFLKRRFDYVLFPPEI